MCVRDALRVLPVRGIRTVFCLLLLAVPLRLATAAELKLLLELVVNGNSVGKIGEFTLRDGALFASRKELTELGLRVPGSVPETSDGLTGVSSLPGVTARLDQPTQTLQITAGPERLLPKVLQRFEAKPPPVAVESGLGAMLDYDLSGTAQPGQTVGTGLWDLRLFSHYGVAASTALTYFGASPSGTGSYAAIRLDSSYVYSDVDARRRYTLGDFANGGLSWTRPVRLGGLQVSSDFTMRPDLVTFPLPMAAGTVGVPSTVDVLVNGTQILSRQVQPGPFQAPQLPVVNGAGTISMRITDALGRQVTTTLPFYASANLLAPGLQTYTAEIGLVRLNWGLLSNDYGDLAGSASYRRGLSPHVTIEAHAEGTAGQFMAGSGLVANLFQMGVLNIAAAGSTASGRSGAQLSMGVQRSGSAFSFGASAMFSMPGFRDIAAMNGEPVARKEITANVGLSLGRYGSFGVVYAAVDRDATPAPISYFAPGTYLATSASVPGGVFSNNKGVVTFLPAQHVHLLTASYSIQYHNIAFYATGYHDFASHGSSGVLFGVTLPLGARSSVSASTSTSTGSTGYAQVQAQQSAVSIGDWGYQAYASVGQPSHEFGQMQYKSPWALVSAGADRFDHRTTFRADAEGALSFADGGLFASNTIRDSFAIVDTNGTKGVHVLDENRPVGRTDSAGRLLVPDLRSFEINHLAIDPTDVPADAIVPYTVRDVRPQDRSGVVVRFPMRAGHGALLVVVDSKGKPIPMGSIAKLAGAGAVLPVGYDGQVFAEDLAKENQLLVESPDGHRCKVSFHFRPVPGDIPKLGPLQCRDDGS